MKKKIYLLIIAIVFSFIFTININAAEPTIKCPTTATLNETFECTVKTDKELMIAPDLAGLKVMEGATEINKDSVIKFKGVKIGSWDISIVGDDDTPYNTVYKTATVEIKEKTTTTKTTTTTTKTKSDNNYLSSIKIDNKEIDDFSKTTTKYFVEVDYKTKKISLKAEAEDEKAEVKIDGPNALEVGDNEYSIAVTSESNSTKYYKVIVTRLEDEKKSSTEIKSIKIKGYRLNFDKTSKTFHLNIKPEDSELDITVKLKDKNASYEIEDNDDLKDGSVIKIIVTAEDETTDTYRIIISKKETNMIPIIIASITLVLIAIVVIIIILNKKNKKNNKNKNKKEEESKITKEDAIERLTDTDNEKTIEMPVIKPSEGYEVSIEEDDTDYVPYDNDEEEQTRILSYAERKELERAKNHENDEELDEALKKAFDFED